jgi:hypothetical protein
VRYVLVDDDAALRAQQNSHLPIESPILVLGPVGPDDGEDSAPPPTGIGPLVTSLTELPVIEGPAVTFALGSLSRLPSDRFEWRGGAWWEVRIAAAEDGGLVELLVPVPRVPLAVEAPVEGARYARLGPAADWLARALSVVETGWIAVVDHWTLLTEPVAKGEDPPLSVDQLSAVRKPLRPRPEELSPDLSVVSWSLG